MLGGQAIVEGGSRGGIEPPLLKNGWLAMSYKLGRW